MDLLSRTFTSLDKFDNGRILIEYGSRWEDSAARLDHKFDETMISRAKLIKGLFNHGLNWEARKERQA
jgi:hypothetical protein